MSYSKVYFKKEEHLSCYVGTGIKINFLWDSKILVKNSSNGELFLFLPKNVDIPHTRQEKGIVSVTRKFQGKIAFLILQQLRYTIM